MSFGLAVAGIAAVATPVEANKGRPPIVTAGWLAPEQFGRGAETIAVTYDVPAGWHLYWRNPGDSGTAPKLDATTTTGATIGGLEWPTPKRHVDGPLVLNEYEGALALPFSVTPGAGDKLSITAKLEWLVCRAEECVPEFTTLTLDRPVGGEARWAVSDRDKLGKARARVPKAIAESPWQVKSIERSGDELRVSLAGGKDVALETAFFEDGELVQAKAPKIEASKDGSGFVVTAAAVVGSKTPGKTSLVLVGKDVAYRAVDVAIGGAPAVAMNEAAKTAGAATAVSASLPVAPTAAPPAATATAALGAPVVEAPPPLYLLLLFALLGGFILNLMPCVLPVLSIKFLALADSDEGRLKQALLYSLGVVVTFGSLGGLLIGLRAAGSKIGWGFHLQSPVVVLALVLLFWLMALNFLGVFEIGFVTQRLAGNAKSTSSFGSGVLAVFVAAPCTGPFMGTAVGAAATLPAVQAIAIFVSLGIGLASPFVLFALSPALIKRLPRPGAWMERLKQFFAFPLFATVLWLIWVLGVQTGTDGWLVASAALLVVSFAIWLGSSTRTLVQGAAWVMAIGVILGAGFQLRSATKPAVAQTTKGASTPHDPNAKVEHYQPWDAAKIETLRKEGKAVFVDFTASWCITCQANKKAVLETDAGIALWKKHEVELFAADWSNEDENITAALATFGRNSVPLYVYYPKGGGAPQVLPQILSLSIIEKLF